MAAETPLTPAASALYSLSRIAASSSCVITHPITAAWALVRWVLSCRGSAKTPPLRPPSWAAAHS